MMADAMLENIPGILFYCHRCNMEFEDVLQEYTCPYCASGFIEQLETVTDSVLHSGQTFSDANMSNIDDVNNMEQDYVDGQQRPTFPLNNIPPVLRDIALLMSGNRGRTAVRPPNELSWTLGRGGPTIGTVTVGPPLVFVGTPGDYVLGGEALDAVVTQLLGQLEHSGPPPMPRDILDAIPTETVSEQQAAANISCSVCWENFQLGETVSKLECEHIFHSSCINPWLQLHATCPICRRSLLPPNHQSDAHSSASTTNTTTTTTTNTTNGDVQRPRLGIAPRVVIRRSTHPLFRRLQTHTWDSPRDMSTSSDSSSSVTTGGLWAPQTRTDSSSSSSTSVNERIQNYHTDFDCD